MTNPQFADHFSTVSDTYATYRPLYPPVLFTWLAGRAPFRKLAWDCACGSGQASRGLTSYFDRVVATDASPQQIAAAKPHDKITYQVATAENSGLADGVVDLITVAQAAHWFDLDAFYAEARRVMKPGGLLALWTYDVLSLGNSQMDAAIRNFNEHVVGPYWPPEREFVRQHYKTLPFPFEDEVTPPLIKMESEWNLEHLLGYFRSWSATKDYIKAKGSDPVDALGAELARHWGIDPVFTRSVVMPLSIRAARL